MPNQGGYLAICSKSAKSMLLIMYAVSLVGCNYYIPYSDEFDGYSLAQGGVIEATGYSVIQSHSGSEPQQRLMAIKAARLDAFRQLAEVVYGTYIDSETTISELTIEDDVFRARVEGVIYGAELIKIEPISDDTYAATLGLPRDMVDDLRLLYMKLVSGN
jgi:hypothetical protein|tara:strand:- start:316 stop:795 length:480 start_codon:yes stop_codon:yes gene_type:complete